MEWSEGQSLQPVFFGFPIHDLHDLLQHLRVLDIDLPFLQVLVLVPVLDVGECLGRCLVDASSKVHQPIRKVLGLLSFDKKTAQIRLSLFHCLINNL